MCLSLIWDRKYFSPEPHDNDWLNFFKQFWRDESHPIFHASSFNENSVGFFHITTWIRWIYKPYHASQSVRPCLKTLHRDLSKDYRVTKTVNLELAFLPVEKLGITGVDSAFLIRGGGPKSEIQKNLVFLVSKIS